jgi:dTDP-4-dehydrorhamnose reductase
MLRLGLQKSPLHVVDDQWGCPSYIGDVAQTLIELIQRPEIPAGIYHYSGKEVVSWLMNSINEIKNAKNKQTVKQACTWVKVGAKIPSGFSLFK